MCDDQSVSVRMEAISWDEGILLGAESRVQELESPVEKTMQMYDMANVLVSAQKLSSTTQVRADDAFKPTLSHWMPALLH